MKQLSEKQIDSMWIDADMDLSKFAKAIAKAHLELRQGDALPIVADGLLALVALNIPELFEEPVVRLSDAQAVLAAKDAEIAAMAAEVEQLKKAIAIAQSAPSTLNEEPVAWRKANSEGFYRYYEADEKQPALCEPLYEKSIV